MGLRSAGVRVRSFLTVRFHSPLYILSFIESSDRHRSGYLNKADLVQSSSPDSNRGDAMHTVFALLLLFASTVWGAAHEWPYSGQEQREIKALSREEVDHYLSGAGLGMAKAAELNRYPGPMHVLEFADNLNLTADQRKRTQAIFDEMKSQVLPLGKQLVEKERELDTRLASETISEKQLTRLVSEIATLNGQSAPRICARIWRKRKF
jgi:hypothetical protein